MKLYLVTLGVAYEGTWPKALFQTWADANAYILSIGFKKSDKAWEQYSNPYRFSENPSGINEEYAEITELELGKPI